MNKKLDFMDASINFIFLVLAFLMPLFFLPITVEFYEFNKLALLTVLTVLGLALWTIKVLIIQKTSVATSKLDLPMLGLVASLAISTFFSLDKTSSVLGSQGRWFPGLFGYITLIVYYYLLASNVKNTQMGKKILNTLVIAISLGSIVSSLAYFNVFLGPQTFFQIQNFSFTGSVTTAVLLATLALILSVRNLVSTESTVSRIFNVVVIFINFFLLAITNTIFGWVTLALGVVIQLKLTDFTILKKNRLILLSLGTILAILTAFSTIPFTRELFANKNYPYEVRLPVSASWIVASSSIRDFPLTGTGLSTFYTSFTRYRPLALNNTNLWSVRFDKPFNELFNILATMGLVGFAAFAFFGVRILGLTKKSFGETTSILNMELSDNQELDSLLNVCLIMSLVFMAVSYSTVLSSFVLFTALGIKVAQMKNSEKEVASDVSFSISTLTSIGNKVSEASRRVKINSEYYHVISAAVFVAIALVGGFLTYRMYAGEMYMRMSVDAANNNDGSKTYDYQAKAIKFNPRRDIYHNAYAQTNLALASVISTKKDLTDEDKQTIQTLVSQAIRSSRISTELLVPTNASSWEVRANIYRSIIGVAPDAEKWAISGYENAITLDPTNPKLRLDLGGIYFSKADYQTAASLFIQAINLKPDYANAYYNLSMAFEGVKDYDNAKKTLEYIKTLVLQDSADYKVVTTELDRIKDMKTTVASNVAGASTIKDDKKPATIAPTTQEPLKNAAITENKVVETSASKQSFSTSKK